MSDLRPVWPSGATCAVALTFDNFGEALDLYKYGHAGGALSDGVYAPRRGVDRVLKLLDHYHLPATFFVEGWSIQKYAALAREIVSAGHEIGSHGWLHENWGSLAPEQERELIRRTTDTLGEVLGRPPRGWRSPGGLVTTSTLALLADAGYDYDSSFADEDVPYRVQVSVERSDELVELPWSWSLDDAVYYAHPGSIRRPAEVADLWIDEFDAARTYTGYFCLVCHPRYSGRPARILALERLVEHIATHSGVWLARCAEVATHAHADGSTPRYPTPAILAAPAMAPPTGTEPRDR
ncbi:MAG TPA: polysaccharide deacetylase [Chloroflexota bacterium]|nr:polysaccharide deacetylase [Chloroflexota bacterium]